MRKSDIITVMAKKTDYIQARMSPELKVAITNAAYKRGQPVTTFILLALAKTYPELTAAVEAERKS